MNKKEILNYLRGSVIGTDPNIIYDREFNPSDESLEQILNLVMARVNPDKELEDIDNNDIYPVTLLCKKDLFMQLATKAAPLYNISTEEIKINKGERFSHYIKLVEAVQKEIDEYNSSGGSFNVTSYEATISGRYFSRRNYELASRPRIQITIDSLENGEALISWRLFNNKFFAKYEVYMINLDTHIVDEYNNFDIREDAELISETRDIHNTKLRVRDLEAGKYTIAVLAYERNGLVGFDEVLIVIPDESDKSEEPQTPVVDPEDKNGENGDSDNKGTETPLPPNSAPNVDQLNPVDKDYVYNGYDLQSIQDEITKALEEVGKEITFERQLEVAEDVFGEVEDKEFSPLFTATGLFISNPEKQQLSMYGYDHNANAIFNVSCEQLEVYAKAIYTEDEDIKPILLNNKHTLVTHSGKSLLELSDYIEFDGLRYNIINIRPHATYIGKVLMYSFECLSYKE